MGDVVRRLARAGTSVVMLTFLVLTSMAGTPAAQAWHQASPTGTARDALERLLVKGRAPLTGYDRTRFGSPWIDVDGNGCDTRNDILRRDLTQTRIAPDCSVVRGVLDDPYTRERIVHVAGRSLIDIDHVVSLSDAWQTGAFRWTSSRRTAFANDPLNLLAVDYAANRQKGDSNAASWLPPNKAYRCAFVARQVAVKARYGLWVTPPEKSAIARILAGCPEQPSRTR